jgi:hypothetical protein
MALQGKGYFTFLLRECEGGNPAAIVAEARAAGLSHVLVKIADGPYAFGVDQAGVDYTLPVVQALRAAGIVVWGWHYVYGNDPANEAAIAIRRARELSLDGYVVDAEEEYKQPGKAFAAQRYMTDLRAGLTAPIALSSYRFPNYHPELPWSAFLEKCDYHMPQVYWEQAHNAGWQLRESRRQCDALPNAKPYLATGAAYGVGDWAPTQADITDFLDTARALDIPAVNFFSWDYCRKHLPGLWQTIAAYPWPAASQAGGGAAGDAASPGGMQADIAAPDAFTGLYLASLNTRKPADMLALYAPGAVHVRHEKVTRIPANIRNDYNTFFGTLPPGPFLLVRADVDGNVRSLAWKVGPRAGRSTIVLKEGRIVLDYLQLL